jgi:hypothetical protein
MTPNDQYYSTPLGSVVGTRLWLLNYPEHVGILCPNIFGGRDVISFTRDGIIRQPVEEFADGEHFTSVKYLGNGPWQTVVWQAEMAVVHRPYHFLNFNCDHFVRYCHGVRMESPQAAFGLVVAAVAMIGATVAVSNQ